MRRDAKGTTIRIILIITLIAAILLSGCSAFGDKRGRCSAGDNCKYYNGNRGVITYLDRPQSTLFFHSKDANNPDGNAVEFQTRLINDGASTTYGAAFISGFDPNLFDVWYIDDTGEHQVNIFKNAGNCFFDLLGFGGNTISLDGTKFVTSCFGVDATHYSNNQWGADVNMNQLGQLFGTNAWPDMNIGLQQAGDGNFRFNFGGDGSYLNFFNHGEMLMSIVTGIDFTSYGGAPFYMLGDNADSPGGDLDYKSFKVRLRENWPAGQDYIRVPYQVKTCYAYTTFVAPMLCVDPNPWSDEKKVCIDVSYSWGGSQGAPVAVTRLEQTNTGKEVIMDITIRNTGPGTVWDVGYLAACSPYFPGTVRPNMHNVVYIGTAWVGNHRVDCSKDMVRLDPRTKEARFTCSYDYLADGEDIGSAYATPLKMELWYGYEEVISNQLTLRRLG